MYSFLSCYHLDFDVFNFNFVPGFGALVAEDFRLSWMYSESHFLCASLEVA